MIAITIGDKQRIGLSQEPHQSNVLFYTELYLRNNVQLSAYRGNLICITRCRRTKWRHQSRRLSVLGGLGGVVSNRSECTQLGGLTWAAPPTFRECTQLGVIVGRLGRPHQRSTNTICDHNEIFQIRCSRRHVLFYTELYLRSNLQSSADMEET